MPFEAVAAATSDHDTWKRLAEEGNDPSAVKRIVERWVQHEAKRQLPGAGQDSGSSRSRSASRDRRGKTDDKHAPRDRSRDRDDKSGAGAARDVRGRERRERSREARDRCDFTFTFGLLCFCRVDMFRWFLLWGKAWLLISASIGHVTVPSDPDLPRDEDWDGGQGGLFPLAAIVVL